MQYNILENYEIINVAKENTIELYLNKNLTKLCASINYCNIEYHIPLEEVSNITEKAMYEVIKSSEQDGIILIEETKDKQLYDYAKTIKNILLIYEQNNNILYGLSSFSNLSHKQMSSKDSWFYEVYKFSDKVLLIDTTSDTYMHVLAEEK